MADIGDLVFHNGYFMVVQEIDNVYKTYRGNLCVSEDDADAHAVGQDPFRWGSMTWQVAKTIHRLKGFPYTAPKPPAEKICTCTTLDLFRAGCSCGAITPYKQVY